MRAVILYAAVVMALLAGTCDANLSFPEAELLTQRFVDHIGNNEHLSPDGYSKFLASLDAGTRDALSECQDELDPSDAIGHEEFKYILLCAAEGLRP